MLNKQKRGYMSASKSTLSKIVTGATSFAMVTVLLITLPNMKSGIKDASLSQINELITLAGTSTQRQDVVIKELASYKNEISEIRNTIDNIIQSPTQSPDNLRIQALETKINETNQKIDALNNIINSSPEKALALPMMRKDIDSLGSSLKLVSDYADKQIDRFLTFFYWITGALASGIIGIAFSQFIDSRKNRNPQ